MPTKPKPTELLSSLRADSNVSEELIAYLRAFGLKGNPIEQRRTRDEAIRELALASECKSPLATAKWIEKSLRNYERGPWTAESKFEVAPDEVSDLHKARFRALRYNAGRSLRYRSILNIINESKK